MRSDHPQRKVGRSFQFLAGDTNIIKHFGVEAERVHECTPRNLPWKLSNAFGLAQTVTIKNGSIETQVVLLRKPLRGSAQAVGPGQLEILMLWFFDGSELGDEIEEYPFVVGGKIGQII